MEILIFKIGAAAGHAKLCFKNLVIFDGFDFPARRPEPAKRKIVNISLVFITKVRWHTDRTRMELFKKSENPDRWLIVLKHRFQNS